MKTTRRGFLRNLSAGTVGAWLAPLLPREVFGQESIRKPYDPLIKHNFLSVCRQCPQGCGVLAEVAGGKVKKLRGNPLHPTNRGTLCARGVSATQLYYNPDRIEGPLRRKGPRGLGEWERIGWDEALQVVGEKLTALRDGGKSHTVAVLVEQLNGLEGLLARRFCGAFGTPNYLDLSQYAGDAVVNAATVMQGLDEAPIFDLANAGFLISLNVPFLEASRNPIQTWKAFAEFRTGKNHARGRFIHFSPAKDRTAAKADEWIPIKPGTEGAVALGIAYVMLQEGLYDHDFAQFHTAGFEKRLAGEEDFPGFHDHVLENYKPGRVAEISGVPLHRIVGLAREFATARAPLALWQDQVGVATQPLATQMAIHSLNALAGNIDRPGGVLVPRKLPEELSPEPVLDSASRNGLSQGSLVAVEHTQYSVAGTAEATFPERVILGSPYPVELLLLYRANPVFDKLNGPEYREALGKIPFSVCVTGFHNDTTQWCDLVLPESHALESWYAGVNYTDHGYPFFNLAEPVLPPRHDTRHVGDIFLELARKCGGSVEQSLPWARFADVAYAYISRINETKTGDVFARPYEEIWTRLLERIGWRARPEGPNAEFWRACLKVGGWWDPVYYHKEWNRSLRTPSGRFEFFPAILWERLQRSRKGETIASQDKARILPHHPEAISDGGRGDYPLSLMVFALDNLAQVESPNQPWLQEITGSVARQQWMTWVDVNPEDAEHQHLVDGDDVWVESERGQARLRCRIDHGMQPGTLRVPFGLGHTGGGRWMKDIGVNPSTLVTPAYDDRVGTPNWQTARVRLRKA